ncbi:MAG: diaminopimelate decarboxylase [Ruminococcus sp.]|jgi:diaminopimelate decarboxylase|nr:diaminopimelate decarboxylase [Ruminococcus sp.]
MDFLYKHLNVNSKGHLTFGGVDTVELAAEFGTPLYVMDENVIRNNIRMFKASIEKYYGGKGLVCYAGKAFTCLEMCRIVKDEGIGLDVVSAGELFTAVKAGVSPEKIKFHGNNKTDYELRYALDSKVGMIVVDNIPELFRLNELCKTFGVKQDIMFRIKPGIDAHTHDFVMTGQIDSKFGFALETGEAFNAVKEALKCENLNLCGVHCHIGSQIMGTEPFEAAADVMLTFIGEIKEKLGHEITEMDLGGGFGIKYTQEDDFVPFEEYFEAVSAVVKKKCADLGIEQPFILIEPGRSIVGEAGITLYTVGAVKDIPGIRTYVSIDGGMPDNPRYALYGSVYTAITANKADKPADMKITLAGKCCESGDLIGKDMLISKCEPGDIIAVLTTGAYNYSMANNYNRIPKPAVVFIKDGKPRIAVRRETVEDLIKNDI